MMVTKIVPLLSSHVTADYLPPLVHPVEAAAKRLAMGKTRFYALISEGKIKTYLEGTRRMVPESELQRHVKACVDAANK